MTTRLKHLAQLVTSCNSSDIRRYVALEHLESSMGLLGRDAEPPDRERPDAGAAAAEPGDVLFGKLRPYLAKTWLVDRPAYASTELLCLRPADGVVPGWFRYLMASKPVVEWAVATSDGSKMPRTSWEWLGEYKLKIPPTSRQRIVADYLDTETIHIDALIEKKQQMIAALNDRFDAVRASTLLGGFDPLTGYGNPPSHWPTGLLGIVIGLHRGFDLPQKDRIDGDVPIVTSGGLNGYHAKAACVGPGVVTGRYGTIGAVFFIDKPYWPLNTTLFVSDFRGNEPKWVYHLLSAIPLDVDSAKSAVTGINRNVIGTLRIPVPPTEVQRALARSLDSASRMTGATVRQLHCQIDLLGERRQALITAAVTGELDLPGAPV